MLAFRIAIVCDCLRLYEIVTIIRDCTQPYEIVDNNTQLFAIHILRTSIFENRLEKGFVWLVFSIFSMS